MIIRIHGGGGSKLRHMETSPISTIAQWSRFRSYLWRSYVNTVGSSAIARYYMSLVTCESDYGSLSGALVAAKRPLSGGPRTMINGGKVVASCHPVDRVSSGEVCEQDCVAVGSRKASIRWLRWCRQRAPRDASNADTPRCPRC